MKRLKLVLLGDSGIGKTRIVKSYIQLYSPPSSLQDILSGASNGKEDTNLHDAGEEIQLKVSDKKKRGDVVSCHCVTLLYRGQPIDVELWDTTGKHEYQPVCRFALYEADIVLFCFNVQDPLTIEHVKQTWFPLFLKNIQAGNHHLCLVGISPGNDNWAQLEERKLQQELFPESIYQNVKPWFVDSESPDQVLEMFNSIIHFGITGHGCAITETLIRSASMCNSAGMCNLLDTDHGEGASSSSSTITTIQQRASEPLHLQRLARAQSQEAMEMSPVLNRQSEPISTSKPPRHGRSSVFTRSHTTKHSLEFANSGTEQDKKKKTTTSKTRRLKCTIS